LYLEGTATALVVWKGGTLCETIGKEEDGDESKKKKKRAGGSKGVWGSQDHRRKEAFHTISLKERWYESVLLQGTTRTRTTDSGPRASVASRGEEERALCGGAL